MKTPDKVSPLGLVQELVLPLGPDNEKGWRVLVAAVCLNRAKGRDAGPVVLKLLDSWPSPASMADADPDALSAELRPLGIQTTRARTLRKLSATMAAGEWVSPADLPGVGEYALTCWRIWVDGEMPDREPNDGWLAAWWRWARGLSPAPAPQAHQDERPTPFDRLPPTEPGDAIYTVRDAARFAQVSVELVRREWNAGRLGGRKTNNRGGFITTRSCLIRWASGLAPLADAERDRL